MNRRKIGLILFWLGVVGLLLTNAWFWISNPVYRVNTPEELNGTIWDTDGWFFSFVGMPTLIGIGLSVIGVLLYSGKKGSLFWLWGLVPLAAFVWLMTWTPSQYLPPLFGIGGGIITFSYLGVLWAWIKTHTADEGIAKTGKHIQLLGYSFLYITGLLLCTSFGQPNLPGLADLPSVSAEGLLVAFSAVWLLHFIGHYMVVRSSK